MNEFRRARRRKAAEAVAVQDMMTEEVSGQIANLSESGMLIQVRRPGMDDALYQFRFQLRSRAGSRAIDVGAHQLWSEPPGTRGPGWAGFRFIDLSEEDLAWIRDWVDEPGGQYA